jgi:hypothetical protein
MGMNEQDKRIGKNEGGEVGVIVVLGWHLR